MSGVPELLLLRLLAQRDMYGYELVKSIRLVTDELIAAHVLVRSELKSWCFRYPRLARLAMPVAFVAVLPLAPVFAGIGNAPVIVRWCACLMLSALVTAAMLFVLQISIGMA